MKTKDISLFLKAIVNEGNWNNYQNSEQNSKLKPNVYRLCKELLNDLNFDHDKGRLVLPSNKYSASLEKKMIPLLLAPMNINEAMVNSENLKVIKDNLTDKIDTAVKNLNSNVAPGKLSELDKSLLLTDYTQSDIFKPNLTETHEGLGIKNGVYVNYNLEAGTLHLHLSHGSEDNIGIKPLEIKAKGGDVLMIKCFMDAERAQEILKDIGAEEHLGTGIIHLKDKEVVTSKTISVPNKAIIFSSISKSYSNEFENPFMYTTLEGSKPLDQNPRSFKTIDGNTVHLTRSDSGNRLALSSDPNFFDNFLKPKIFPVKATNGPDSKPYTFTLDFSKLDPKLGDQAIIAVDALMGDDFSDMFLDENNNVKYEELNDMLRDSMKGCLDLEPISDFQKKMINASIDKKEEPKSKRGIAEMNNSRTNEMKKKSGLKR